MSKRILMILAAVSLTSVPALAQKSKKPEAAPAAKHLTFEDDQVEGGRDLPQFEVVGTVQHGRHPSLIRIRTTFVPELLKSAANQ
jgi:hypothetical protein